MSKALPKWTDERSETLQNFVGDEVPVSVATVAEAAEVLETSARSIAAKLRKLGFEVQSSAAASTKKFSQEQEDTLKAFVVDNSGEFTYADIAANFAGAVFSAKSIQGKILSMELTAHVKPAEKVESVKTYNEDEEGTIREMAGNGAFLEEIAKAVDRPLNSVRGKCLSMVRSGDIEKIPTQKETKSANKVDALEALGDLAEMSVEAIAEAIEKTPRGVRTMLTRRGLTCADYDGAAKKAKSAEKAE